MGNQTLLRSLCVSVCVCVDDDQLHMVKHILKSVCSDLTNAMLNFLSDDYKTTVDNPSTITAEVSSAVSMVTRLNLNLGDGVLLGSMCNIQVKRDYSCSFC